MAEYDGGTKLKDVRNRQIFPYTKAEYVEGLEDYLGGSITPPDDAEENSIPIVNNKGDVEWGKIKADSITVNIEGSNSVNQDLNHVLAEQNKGLKDVNTAIAGQSNEITNINSLVAQLSKELTDLQDKVNNGMPSNPDTPVDPSVPAGFIPTEVSELPEVGKIGVVYRVPSENTSSLNMYDEFYWTGNRFEKIGNRDPGGDEWNSNDGDSGYTWLD